MPVDFTTRVGDLTQAMEVSAVAAPSDTKGARCTAAGPHVCPQSPATDRTSAQAAHYLLGGKWEPDAIPARSGRACILRRAPHTANRKWTLPGRFHCAQAMAGRSGQLALDQALAMHFHFCFVGGFICER